MRYNKSTLRKGGASSRWKKKEQRFTTIVRLKEEAKWTWTDIGKRFRISRQAAFKFYTENKKLL